MDQRRFKRFTVEIMGISGKIMFANKVEILDLSCGGVAVRVDRRLNIGNKYIIKLANKTSTLAVAGSVVWSRMSGTKHGEKDDVIPLYTAGMKFLNITAENFKDLTGLIEDHFESSMDQATHTPDDQRLHVRIYMKTPQPASLKSPEDYNVKKISLGGMLIESVHALKIQSKMSMEMYLENDKIGFQGRVASCSRISAPDKECFDIGIEFLEMPDDDREKLSKFVEGLEKPAV